MILDKNVEQYLTYVIEYVEKIHGSDKLQELASDPEKYLREYNEAFEAFQWKVLLLGPNHGGECEREFWRMAGSIVYNRINAVI